MGIAEVFGIVLQVAVVVGEGVMGADIVEIEVAGVEAPVGAGNEEQVGGSATLGGTPTLTSLGPSSHFANNHPVNFRVYFAVRAALLVPLGTQRKR